MTVLVIGRTGQLATELQRVTWASGEAVTAIEQPELDLADANSVAAAVKRVSPSILVNAAAFTAVDRAETERGAAMAINHLGPLHLAEIAKRHGIPLIHVSTDYVFDGRSARPWREDDVPAPLGMYGQSKLAGENAIRERLPRHIILRTSWLFAAHGQNFVRTMLRLGAERTSLSVVDDQVGCPTAASDLARVIVEISRRLAQGDPAYGTYHYCGSGVVTWCGFARTIFDNARLPKAPTLLPITTAQFGAPAPRPAYSVLDCGKIERNFGIRQRPWIEDLRTVLNELRPSQAP